MNRMVAISSVLLASALLAPHAHAQSGLVAGYAFEEAAGTSAADLSGLGHPALLVGATRAAGRYGDGIVLDGTSAHARVDSPAHPTGNFSWLAWVQPSTVSGWRALMEIQTAVSAGVELAMLDGRLELWVSGSRIWTQAPPGLAAGAWSHVALTRSGPTWIVYVGGTLAGSADSAASLDWGSCPLLLGIDADAGCDGSLSGAFAGLLDEVRVYDRPLSEAEVRAALGASLSEEVPSGWTNVRWQQPATSAPVAEFRVYVGPLDRQGGRKAWSGLPTADASGVYSTSLVVEEIVTGDHVYLWLTAANVAGESAPSNSNEFNAPPLPTPPDPPVLLP